MQAVWYIWRTRAKRQRAKIACRWCGAILALLACLGPLASCTPHPAAEIFATGLNQPRGLAFDSNGDLLVAEAGMPDPAAAGGPQPEINHSSRVLRIDSQRHMVAVLDELPFTHYSSAGDIGAADIAVLNGTIYVLTGEGYDDNLSRSILRVSPGAPPHPVASILNFALGTTPLEYRASHGGAPTNPYAIAAAPDGRAVYVADGASGRVLRVTLDGRISAFAELPNMPPLAGLAFGPDGALYIAMFSAMPHTPGSGEIWAADRSGRLRMIVEGLTMPIDVGFDKSGTMYVLEFSDGLQPNQPYAAWSGRLLRFEPNGAPSVLLDRLNYPTAMAFSETGDLYISLGGAFSEAGQGAILKLPCTALDRPGTCPQ